MDGARPADDQANKEAHKPAFGEGPVEMITFLTGFKFQSERQLARIAESKTRHG